MFPFESEYRVLLLRRSGSGKSFNKSAYLAKFIRQKFSHLWNGGIRRRQGPIRSFRHGMRTGMRPRSLEKTEDIGPVRDDFAGAGPGADRESAGFVAGVVGECVVRYNHLISPWVEREHCAWRGCVGSGWGFRRQLVSEIAEAVMMDLKSLYHRALPRRI